LEGNVTIGLYAINPSSQRCKWVAIDADYKNAMEDLVKLQYYLTQDNVNSAPEMSKRGGHLWIFLAVPLLARKCRIYIYNLAGRLGVPVKGSGLAEGIEVFPRHDAIANGAFGNAIRGPLGIHRGADRRFWFYGADYTLEAQMKFLKRLRRVTEEELDRFTAGKELPADIAKSQGEVKPIGELRTGGSRKVFCILNHVAKTRIVGKNHVARCPSCAQTGHDRSGDNLAILVSDPRFYQCWAGCTKEMIVAPLGTRFASSNAHDKDKEVTCMSRLKFTGIAGLPLSRRAMRVLKDRGIFAHSLVSIEHQQLAQRYVVRGLESGGSAGDVGRYVSFAGDEGQPSRLSYLQKSSEWICSGKAERMNC